jgi:hypothetical protein
MILPGLFNYETRGRREKGRVTTDHTDRTDKRRQRGGAKRAIRFKPASRSIIRVFLFFRTFATFACFVVPPPLFDFVQPEVESLTKDHADCAMENGLKKSTQSLKEKQYRKPVVLGYRGVAPI